MKDRELFLSALEIEDPAARMAHLKNECGDDAALLARVEALLSSHDSHSQFLNTPVVEQIVDVSDAGNAATMLFGNGSTRDGELAVTAAHFPGPATMTEPPDDADDEIPLGYLEPSTKPGSKGRLGHYEVLEVIGRGAFGTVLRAFDEKLHRVVAIKVLMPEMATNSPARKRFIREAQASAAIRHEHVVSIYAVEEQPIPYLVMEFIPGQTLQQRLDERGPLDVPGVLRLGRQIAEGLAAAHAQHLIHRDIKPGNILLEGGATERVKITDFGLARTADDASLTQSGLIAGTPMYMAPEQALGHKLDPRADLFSFGSVLYQMVSGRPPFRAPNMIAVLKRVTEDQPRPIQEIIPEVPTWLCDIIAKLHAKHPDERHQSAQEVADVLADCEAQLKANARLQDFSRIPATTSAKSVKWNWFTAGGVVGVMLLLAVIIITLTNQDGTKTSIEVPEGTTVSIDAGKDGRVDITAADRAETQPSMLDSRPSGSQRWTADVPPPANFVAGELLYEDTFDNREKHNLFVMDDGKQRHAVENGIYSYHQFANAFPAGYGGHGGYGTATANVSFALRARGRNHAFGIPFGQRGDVEPFSHLQFYLWPDGKWALRRRLGINSEREIAKGAVDVLPENQWFTLFVQQIGPRTEVTFNGKRLCDVTETDIPAGNPAQHAVRFGGWVVDHTQDGGWDLDYLMIWNPGTVSSPPTSPSVIPTQAAWHGWPADAPKPAIAPFDAAQARAHQEAWAKYLGVPVEYTNSIGMMFRLIPPGEFTMGSTEAEIEAALKEVGEDKHWRECIRSEAPQHKVLLTQPIYLGVNEVTQAEYEQVMGVNPSHFAPMGAGKEAVAGLETADHPVEMVSWNDAAEFCAKLSKQEKLKPFYFRAGETITPLDGTGYRLPSEAEWEFACRAGTATKYWIGDQDEDLMRVGWFGGNSGGRTHAAGELKANPFGLSDIHGNAWEWVRDGWDATWYGQFQEQPAINPNSPFSAGFRRVVRGGGWGYPASGCRSSNRNANDPSGHYGNIGFRVSLVVDAVKAAKQQTPQSVTKKEPLPPTFKNGIGMEFVIVPKGKSWLGGGKDKLGDQEVEIPADFYLGKFEVTQEEWEQVMGENPSHFSRTGYGNDAVQDIPDANLKRFPAENVSWDRCQEFVAKLNQREKATGWVYRLPKLTEWEYACRGGPMSDQADSAFDHYLAQPTNTLLPEAANFDKGMNRTCEVGSYQPNRLELFDLHGNVQEWCEDGAQTTTDSSKRLRGGSFRIGRCEAKGVAAAESTFRGDDLGLRLARVPSGAPSPAAKTRAIDPPPNGQEADFRTTPLPRK